MLPAVRCELHLAIARRRVRQVRGIERAMTMRTLSIGILSVALAAAPLTTASAHGFHHHGFGLIGGLFHAAGAVAVGAAMVATATIPIVADASGAGRGGYDHDRGGYRGCGGYGQRDPRDAY